VPNESSHRNGTALRLIGAFKLLKALLLAGVALGAFNLLNPATAEHADRLASMFAWRFGPQAMFSVHYRLTHLENAHLPAVALIACLYGLLFAVEGVGLWMGKRWAEYLTLVATSSLVPFEIYELVQRVSWPRVATLVVNLLVVGYLFWRLRQGAPHKR
jgi:uncharacterized membrane protein (DUF2068 family)